MNSFKPFAIHRIAVKNIGIFLSRSKEQVCVFVATKTSRMPVGTGQTCLLRPMVAKGKMKERLRR
jgi:proline racemase